MAQRLTAVLGALLLTAAGCGHSQPAVTVPAPASPLPTAGLAGEPVAVYPLTLIAADDALGWDSLLTPRRAALDRADSIMGAMLKGRSPEVNWVLPPALRRAAERAPGLLTDPDQMGTALLRYPNVTQLPDPLRSQMRSLTGVVAERYAFVPASLLYFRGPDGRARVALTLVLADVRTGLVGWRTVATAEGDNPWAMLRAAFKTLTPSLP